jgi:hypothetical protein
LRRAQPEDRPAQAPQPRGLHLQPDDEQEHDDAELGDVQYGLRIGEQAEAERADDEAGDEVAEHRAQPDALEDRHGDDAGGEQGDDLDEVGCGCFGCHFRCSPDAVRRRDRPAQS